MCHFKILCHFTFAPLHCCISSFNPASHPIQLPEYINIDQTNPPITLPRCCTLTRTCMPTPFSSPPGAAFRSSLRQSSWQRSQQQQQQQRSRVCLVEGRCGNRGLQGRGSPQVVSASSASLVPHSNQFLFCLQEQLPVTTAPSSLLCQRYSLILAKHVRFNASVDFN